jgi:hypothetical protein
LKARIFSSTLKNALAYYNAGVVAVCKLKSRRIGSLIWGTFFHARRYGFDFGKKNGLCRMLGDFLENSFGRPVDVSLLPWICFDGFYD